MELSDVRAIRIEPIADGFQVEFGRLGGVETETVLPEELGDSPRVILYFHGGGYLIGSADQYRGATVTLARAVEARAVVPNYRLAPEHPFPAAHEDAWAVYRQLIGAGVDPVNLAVAGDSAGAALSISVLVRARDEGLPLAACATLNSPYADMTASSPSLDDPKYNQGRVKKALVTWMMGTYLGANDADPKDPRHSPVYADLTGLPPLLIQTGGLDPLNDDGTRLAARARECGVNVRLTDYPTSNHIWVVRGTNPFDPEAEKANEESANFIREHTA
jgi:monoterpene epsilon-lactone hydrolase